VAAQELVAYLLFCGFSAFVVAAGFFCATVLLARLRGASLYHQLRLIKWGRSVGLLLGLGTLGLLLVAGWPYLVGNGAH